MNSKSRLTQKMAREAFGLLLELRERQDAAVCLSKALAFLEVLARDKKPAAANIVLSIRVLQLRKP